MPLKIDNQFSNFYRYVERISEISGITCALAILSSAGILTYEVMMRYVFETPTIWEIEFSVYLLIMATFIGGAYGLKSASHIHIDLITHLLSSKVKFRLSLITSIGAFLFCLVLAITGWKMWWEAFCKGWRSDSLWGPPLWIPYIFLPLGMTLLCLQYVVQIHNLWKKIKAASVKENK